MNRSLHLLILTGAGGWLAAGAEPAPAAKPPVVTAVYADVESGYARKKNADGSYQREYYALSKGGYSPGVAKDRSIDDLGFPAIAGTLAEQLARQNYFLARDTKSADILIVVRWGKTIPYDTSSHRDTLTGMGTALNQLAINNAAAKQPATPGLGQQAVSLGEQNAGAVPTTDQAATLALMDELQSQMQQVDLQNRVRDRTNEKNAALLGYLREVNRVNDIRRLAGGGHHYHDLISELEGERYYVILEAFDFREATQHNRRKRLWVTRMSIRAEGNKFDEQLAEMAAAAARYFGQASGRLVHRSERETKVSIGEARTIEIVPESELPREPDKEE